MDSLIKLKQDFVNQIQCFEITKYPNKEIVVLHSYIKGNNSLLNWLKAQTSYPQFYFHYRDQNKIIATIGNTRTFYDQQQACHFTQQEQQTLVGGVQFNGEAYFVLPKIFLQQEQNTIYAKLIIDLKKNWDSEKQELLQLLEQFNQVKVTQTLAQNITFISQTNNQQAWCNWVEQALNAIEQGKFNKVVLANDSCYQSNIAINPYDFLAASEKYNKGCYHFLLAQNENETFLGSSPECLYQRNHQQLNTEALAGTAKYSENEQENQQQAHWLLNDEKNIYENALVAKDIAQNLSPYLENIYIGERTIKVLRKVQHLKRLIKVNLKNNVSDNDCLNAIHPTAAVAGLPKKQALKFLTENEHFSRRWYAGTLGILSKDEAEFCVTIRSAIIKNNHIQVFAGAGIVAGSIPLVEWQEIERKALGLISLLQQTKR